MGAGSSQHGPAAPDAADQDSPAPEELTPTGGSWSGLLFDNPTIDLKPQLTWTFEVAFQDIVRDYGITPVALTIDWVPLSISSWREMTGAKASSTTFADPIEGSVYFFEHHRYDLAGLAVVEQRTEAIRLTAEVEGDIDGLGVPGISVDEWLRFEGITVQLSGVDSIQAASNELASFTDVGALVGEEMRPGTFQFKCQPAQESAGPGR